jgi:lambda repressor-like predicted transcriptional regulator
MKPLDEHLKDSGIDLAQLIAKSGLDARVVKLIVAGNYTPSPGDRNRIADVLGVAVDEIAWGHVVPVQHLRGNGPQTGRAT